MEHFNPNFVNLVPGLFYFCNKNGVSAIKWMVLLHNWAYCISNTLGTKFMKFGLKYTILYFKTDKTICIWNFLEPLQEIHVKNHQSSAYVFTKIVLYLCVMISYFWLHKYKEEECILLSPSWLLRLNIAWQSN